MNLAAGARLGPYEIVELLGSGGMGEVYRGRDPRLGRDVAVKVLPEAVAGDPERLRRFEREARATSAISHPNVVVVFDVGSTDGRAYVVTELLEGRTLRERLERGPVRLPEAMEWAIQAAEGLAAAHAEGIAHRDLKPDNLFLTREGRLKILDFGLARWYETTAQETTAEVTDPGTRLGTVGYMSPEQVRGLRGDHRSDIFSLGTVLYEVLSGKHPFRRETGAETQTAILREEPARLSGLGLPEALERIVRRCLEKRPEDRFDSAQELASALKLLVGAPAAGVSEAEEPSPYPGLRPFTEAEAGRFYGREAEVQALWQKLQERRLLAVIGPSGAGKTSFVRAGVVASRPSGWAAVVTTPGTSPLLMLAQALAPDLAGDPEAVAQLLRFEDVDVAAATLSRWRHGHASALLVVDQLEELFTLNPPEVQARFAGLLGRLTGEADIHVLLSIRDDFLMRCDEHEALAPVFESLTPLRPLGGDGLRRALVEPAKKEGLRFEDDALVEEMLAAVEGERGALPLLAFAAARLWERRDREKRALTRAAYEEIGGVAGALAQHAEATLERIGPERQGIVREIFRNLVTSQGTRASIAREELLSVFGERREDAEEVLLALIGARLLTSYEVAGVEAEGGGGASEARRHRIEVVHESLLKAWPRLVRWQTQDEEGAQLRDQLKQAAHLWEEKGRPEDLLWAGTSEREFELWRERYPGALTALEEDFSGAMVERARRRRRLRRIAVGSIVAASLAVAVVVGVSRQQVAGEARRAEASKLLTLAQLHLEDDPTEALAFTTASLEVFDTREARVFAMKALWEAPPALELSAGAQVGDPTFSPDGRWLAAGQYEGARVWSQTGEVVGALREASQSPYAAYSRAVWGPRGLLLIGRPLTDRVEVWPLPSGERIRTIGLGGQSFWGLQRERLVAATLDDRTVAALDRPFLEGTLTLRSWLLPDGEAQDHGQVDARLLGASSGWFEPNGTGWLYTKGRTIHVRPLPAEGRGDWVVGRLDSDVRVAGQLDNDVVVFREDSGRVHTCCSLTQGRPTLIRSFPKPETAEGPVFPDRSGRWLVNNTLEEARGRVWSTSAWPGARPLALRRRTSWLAAVGGGLHPSGDWAVVPTNEGASLTFWPLRRPHATVVEGYSDFNRPVVYSPDSRWLATNRPGDRHRLWPVGADERSSPPIDLPEGTGAFDVGFGPEGRFLFVARPAPPLIVPLDGSPPRPLEGFSEGTNLLAAAVSPSGRRVATAFSCCGTEKTLRVWDLETGDVQVFDLPRGPTRDGRPAPLGIDWGITSLAFEGESTLYSGGAGGIRRWRLDDGTQELVFASRPGYGLNLRLGDGGRKGLVRQLRNDNEKECLPVELVDLRMGHSEPLPAFGGCPQVISGFALDASGTIAATADQDGLVRVGRLGAGEPHLLAGHEGAVQSVAISPDLQWVASAGVDGTLRLWPMPDLSKPPLHTLPHEELLAKLESLTNLRAVRDAESPTGWTIELGPFPGWEEVPTW